MVESNEADDAFSCFNNCLRLVLRDDKSLKMVAESTDYGDPRESYFLKLAKTIFLFEARAEFESISKEFYDAVIKTLNSNDLLKEMIEHIPTFKASGLCKDLFTYRVSWLKEKLKEKPTFSWRMPEAEFPDHKLVEEFLRSDQEKFSYTGVFDANNSAKDFVGKYKYRRMGDKFSVDMGYNGKGSDGRVRITKTKSYFNEIIRVYEKYEFDLKEISKLGLDI